MTTSATRSICTRGNTTARRSALLAAHCPFIARIVGLSINGNPLDIYRTVKAVDTRESLRPYGFGNTFGVLGPGSGVESNVPMPPLSGVGVTVPKLTTGVPGVMRWWTAPPNDGAPEAMAERPRTLPAMQAAAPTKYPKRLVTF
jgi:hypothetical protein